MVALAATCGPATAEEPVSKKRPLPFHGKITAVDVAAQSLTLSGKKARVVHVTPQTRVTKGDRTATIADAIVGEEVAGSAMLLPEGKLEAKSLRIGPKPADKSAPARKQKAKGT
jgi:hypothetical protein